VTARSCDEPGCERAAKTSRRKCGPHLYTARHEKSLGAERVPLDPLLAWVWANVTREPVSVIQTAKVVGVDNSQLHRWRRTGVRLDLADRLAIRLGVHPAVIWGEHWWAGTEASA
jgi:hypothetical protein